MSGSYSEANTHIDAMATNNAAIFGGDVSVGPHNNGKLGVGMLLPSASLDVTGDLRVSSHITASGNISASGNIKAATFTPTNIVTNRVVFFDGSDLDDSVMYSRNGGIDVEGNITASGNISGSATSNLTIGGNIIANSGSFSEINLPADNQFIKLGASGDLQLYHNGSNSFIDDAGTGDLRLRGSTRVRLQGMNETNMVTAVQGGAVALYHDNNEKLITTAAGINISGEITASGNISASGNILTSGNITSLGTITAEQITSTDDITVTDDLNVQGQINLSSDIVHTLDSDTKIAFEPDKITLAAGGVDMITLTEAATDTIALGAAISSHITASGNISGSATSTINVGGNITTLSTGSFGGIKLNDAKRIQLGTANDLQFITMVLIHI